MISDYYFAMEIPYKESMKLSTANTENETEIRRIKSATGLLTQCDLLISSLFLRDVSQKKGFMSIYSW